jgi:hypothetical protein
MIQAVAAQAEGKLKGAVVKLALAESARSGRHFRTRRLLYALMASSTAADPATQPKMPPWALIIFNPMSWNSGK